jgi:DNA-binding protein HU-beta
MLTKADLINTLYENGVAGSKIEGERMIDAITGAIAEDLVSSKDGGLIIKGFGRFYVGERKAGVGRNVRTGELIQIPTKHKVRFKPAKALADRINGG